MAISRMKKVLIAGHLAEYESFVHLLQNAGIVHLSEISEDFDQSLPKPLKPEQLYHDAALLKRIKQAYEFMQKYEPKESVFKKLFRLPRMMKQDDFQMSVRLTDPVTLADKAESIQEQISELKAEENKIHEENTILSLWKDVNIPMRDLGKQGSTLFHVGKIPVKKLHEIKSIEGLEVEILQQNSNFAIILVLAHESDAITAMDALRRKGFEEIAIAESEASPSERFNKNKSRLKEIKKELKTLAKLAGQLTDQIDKCMLLLEHYTNSERRSRVYDFWLSTENSFILQGWVKEQDAETLNNIIDRFESIVLENKEQEKGEKPPIAYENRPLFSPFQLITKLYSTPAYEGFDPSAIMSIFFVLFFGITLTDAGYGLILALIALIFMIKLKKTTDVLWIIFWGGTSTVVAGLLTGGIFGDLFRLENPYMNVPALSSFRESVLWFDPMKDPMIFFRLVLLLGLIHIITGLLIGLYSTIKQKRYMDAIVEYATWLGIVLSLVAILFSSSICIEMSLLAASTPPFPVWLQLPAKYIIMVSAVIIVVFAARDEESVFFRYFIGFLKLVVLSGIFSYLGDILSYIRLMALGMVTAGIGMAINTIAFMMVDIPVVGIILTIVVMIFGHIFNLAINLLGGFVHTLRLQYVEFFSKFFIGGGVEFSPLSNSGKYVKIIE